MESVVRHRPRSLSFSSSACWPAGRCSSAFSSLISLPGSSASTTFPAGLLAVVASACVLQVTGQCANALCTVSSLLLPRSTSNACLQHRAAYKLGQKRATKRVWVLDSGMHIDLPMTDAFAMDIIDCQHKLLKKAPSLCFRQRATAPAQVLTRKVSVEKQTWRT